MVAVPAKIIADESVLMVGTTNSQVEERWIALDANLEPVVPVRSAKGAAIFKKTLRDEDKYYAWTFSNGSEADITAVSAVDFQQYLNTDLINGYKVVGGKNLVSPLGNSHGYVESLSYGWSANWISTNLIFLKSKETISFNISLLSPRALYVLLSKDLSYLGRGNIATNSAGMVLYHNDTGDDVYLYVTQKAETYSEIKAVIGEFTAEQINSMGDMDDHISKDVIPDDLTDKKSSSWNEVTRYKGMNYSALGDSLTAAGSGGVYLNVIDMLLGTTNTNCGVGGTRVSGSSNSCMWQDVRINAMNIDSDFVIIMGGSNDVGKGLSVSDSDFSLSNHDTDNFVGAYNVMLSKIVYKFMKFTNGYYADIDYSGITQVSEAKDNFFILIVTPPKIMSEESKQQESLTFAGYVKRIAQMWGIPCVDANSNMFMSIMTYGGLTDKVHFGTKWHNRLGRLVVSKLKEIEPIN